jgi:uncharacterized delta-60 repeat protein
MNAKWAGLLAAVIAVLVAAPAAHAAGELERHFGEGGKAVLPLPLGVPWHQADVHLATAPDGDIVEAAGDVVVRFSASGSLDPAFGERGLVNVALPGRARFELGDVGVDPEGRVVLMGTALTGSGAKARSSAAVLRYLPDGQLDSSFGSGGIVIGTFGLRSESLGGITAVRASLGGVDQQGRITFVLSTSEEEARCGGPAQATTRTRALARLTPAGALDPTFGKGGITRIAPLESVAQIALGKGGGAILAGSVRSRCTSGPESAALSIGADGRRRLGFADRGVRRFPGRIASITLDGSGRTVVLFKEKRERGTADQNLTKLLRLLPDGELDPDFSGGWVYYESTGPLYKWSTPVVEPGGGIVLVGTLVRPLPENKKQDGIAVHRWVMAEPIRPDGQLGSGFGWLGYISIMRFGSTGDATATDAVVDSEGELLIAGAIRKPGLAPEGGLLLARLELRHPNAG